MALADFWNLPPSGKDRIIQDLPAPKTPMRNRRCPKCRKADARECFADRQPSIAKVKPRDCDCECHYH